MPLDDNSERRCYYCNKEEDLNKGPDGKIIRDLKPFGPNNSLVCFDCGTSKEHNANTATNYINKFYVMSKITDAAMLTDDGPIPYIKGK